MFWDTRMGCASFEFEPGKSQNKIFRQTKSRCLSNSPPRRLFSQVAWKPKAIFIAQAKAVTTTTSSSPWKYLMVLLLSFTAFSNVLLPLLCFAAVWTSKIWWCAWVQSTHHPKPQPSSVLSALAKLKLLAKASRTSRWVEGFLAWAITAFFISCRLEIASSLCQSSVPGLNCVPFQQSMSTRFPMRCHSKMPLRSQWTTWSPISSCSSCYRFVPASRWCSIQLEAAWWVQIISYLQFR